MFDFLRDDEASWNFGVLAAVLTICFVALLGAGYAIFGPADWTHNCARACAPKDVKLATPNRCECQTVVTK